MKYPTVSLFLALIWAAASLAQTPLHQAFKDSYTLEKNKQYTEAIAKIKPAFDDSYEANLRLGWLHYLAGKHSEALNYYKQSIKKYPMSIEAKLGYINPAAKLGQWDAVLEQYLAILRIDPNHSYANYNTGLVYYYRKQYTTAESYFQKVVNLYPFDYSSLLMLGWTKAMLGKKSEAKVLFNKALLYSPDDSSAKEGLQYVK